MAIKKDQGNNIQEQSYQIIERDYERGILALASPTGTGKTYGGFQYMVHTDKKCFFVTPHWKNLSISDEWVAEASRCQRTWGTIRSNLECMERYFWEDYDDGQRNHWFSNDILTFQERQKIVEQGIHIFSKKSKTNSGKIENVFSKLKKAMKNYHWIYQTWQTTHSPYYQDDLKDKKAKAGRAEYAFRNAVLREFRDRYSTPKRREKALEDEEKWIGVLYPYVHVRKWDIVFLMAIRFVLPFNDFIGNTRSFFNYKDILGNRPLLEDSSVLLDESPQIYKIWFQYLTQEPVSVDMLKTLRSVHTALNDDRWKNPAQGRDMNSFQDFQDKTNFVFNKFQGSKEFKRENSQNREITFSNGPKV